MEHHFNTEYAVKYGIEEAIVINNLQFWITKNIANKKHFYNERTWTYNSYKAFSEIFPYWNEHKMKRILDSLVIQGILLRENYNKSGYDRTCWYAFKDENSFLQNYNIHIAELQDGSSEIAKPIPYNNTFKKTSTNKFIKPTIEEVKIYCVEIGYNLDAEKFCDHYDSNGWLVGKNPMKDWKASIRTWKRNSSKFEIPSSNNKITTKIKLD
jgi:DNA-binding transcriptional regulator GbsR (MarR family)